MHRTLLAPIAGVAIAVLVIGAVAVLIPGLPLVTTILISQDINGLILPAVLIYMLILINDRRLMGRYTNNLAANAIAGITAAALIVLTGLLLLGTFGIPL